jgi:oligosaccharide reducing-end xylanase
MMARLVCVNEVVAAVIVASGAMTSAAADRAAPGDAVYRNLFREYLNRSEVEVGAKLDAAWQQLFRGDEATQRIYYPVGEDAAYVLDTGNDVRSEGISYGLMIAVQFDRRAEFDRLWTWAKRYMYHASGPRRGCFAWQCACDGRKLDPGSPSDGEEWIAMAAVAGLAADRSLAQPFVERLWAAPIPEGQWRY